MKNLKKLLVTMLALVLLICSATVVSLAADTPAEIMAEAQTLLDEATKEDAAIAARSQKMRELDKLIESNMATIRDSQEWLKFQVNYKAHQDKLREDCVVAANQFFDELLEKDTTKARAETLYAGLSSLVSRQGDLRGYFDTESQAFEDLVIRLKVAEAINALQAAEDAVLAKDKGASLLKANNCMSAMGEDAAVTATEDYKILQAWFKELYNAVDDILFAEIRALVDEACLASTGFERAKALCDEIESYFKGCYFNTSVDAFTEVRFYANYAIAYAYLNQIERTRVLETKGEYLLQLHENTQNLYLSNLIKPYYEDFHARYNALKDASDAGSLVSLLCKKAEGYKKEVADVFVEGYQGPLKSADEITAVIDELEKLVVSCYLGNPVYEKDVVVARAYVAFYDFWVAMKAMEEAPEDYIARNALYKNAVAFYNSNSGSILMADSEYRAPLMALYESLCADASAEILAILNDWLKVAESADNKDGDGAFVASYGDVRDAYDKLMLYYLDKTTALYFRATEDKSLTSRIKAATEKAEARFITELGELLGEISVKAPLPENLADIEADALTFRIERIALLASYIEGLSFTYSDYPTQFEAFASNYYIEVFLTKLCQIEAAFKAGDDDAAVAFYNELKVLVNANLVSVDINSEGYLLYLSHLNKIEVRMGNANVPGARPYLDALAAVVDADSFDKVYALMHLDEYVRNNKIARPGASDTTSASALFYQEYDALANKVKVWRQAIVDEREKNVSLGDYNSSGVTIYDGDTKQATAQKGDHTFIAKDGREYGSDGSAYYTTLEFTKGSSSDGYIALTLPSKTENIVIEMDITTFTHWPTSKNVPFDSGAYGLESGKRVYPILGYLSPAGQLIAPSGSGHSTGPTITDREGGIIIPGQWTRLIICYNAKEKKVSYYVNDEKIVHNGVDEWSCWIGEDYNFTEALRIGNGDSSGGSISLDNVRIYIGNQPRNVNLFNEMSDAEKFVYYTNYVLDYINNGVGTAADAKFCYDEIQARIGAYWGSKQNPDGTPTEATYLFDASTYWSDGADPGVTYAELKAAVDSYQYVTDNANSVIEGQMIESVCQEIQSKMQKIVEASGLAGLSTRQLLLAELDAYTEANLAYIAQFNAAQQAAYEQVLATKETVLKEVEAYTRANEYIETVNKFAAARDLYSRTVYKNAAESLMAGMEKDAALGYFDLEMIKGEVAEFAAAITLFAEQDALLTAQIIKDNNKLIVDCMARFPGTADDAMKQYSTLNKYIVMVRRILLEGNYDASDPKVEAAIVLYNIMNDTFYDALQRDHAATLQDLIDRFNSQSTPYIEKLGIYRAVTKYLEDNSATIDPAHDAIKGIYSQYEIMEEKFGTDAGRDEQWLEYEKILNSNTLQFITLVTQMRFETRYNELLRLRDEAAKLFYFMDSSSPEAQLAVENYQACEAFLEKAVVNGDKFIELAYALKKASGMKNTYLALLAAQAAFADVDPSYGGALVFTEKVLETTQEVTLTMEEAIKAYEIILSEYTSFVTVINAEIELTLDVVCTVRASFPINRTMVALFKKFYD